MSTITVSEIAAEVGAEVEGDGARRLSGVAPLERAGPEHLTFFAEAALRSRAEGTTAGAVLAPETFVAVLPDTAILRVADPRAAFARVLSLFHPEPASVGSVHPTAVIARGVEMGPDVSVGPYVVVGEGTTIGAGTRIEASTSVGRAVRIGAGCRIAPGVSILHGVEIGDRVLVHTGARIGTDGFGYAPTSEGAKKIPQVGGCRIADDVEIGANCTIDRGAIDDTVIGARTKLDNLVHIAHNVIIGEDCMIVAQVGIAGSSVVGAGSALAGQVGVADHVTIAPGARIAAQSGVIRDVPEGATHGGYPAQRHSRWMRITAASARLPALLRRVAAIERRLGIRGGDEHEDAAVEDGAA